MLLFSKMFLIRTIRKIILFYYKISAKLGKGIIKPNIKFSPSTDCLTIKKNGEQFIIYQNIKPGKYEIKITHHENIIKNVRRSLIIYINPSMQRKIGQYKDDFNANINEHGLYSYMGYGLLRKGIVTQHHKIEVKKYLPWIKLTIKSLLNKDINLESIKLELIRETQKDVSTFDTVSPSVLMNLARNQKIDFILYANISMNIIDGSSIWYSSMANILGSIGNVLIILKENLTNNLILDNIKNTANIIIISPKDLDDSTNINVQSAISLICAIDKYHPEIKAVFLRGMDETSTILHNRQFKGRVYTYLTNFYSIQENCFSVSPEQSEKLKYIASHKPTFLTQTREIATQLRGIVKNRPLETCIFPPALPNEIIYQAPKALGGKITILYSGKITPNWGVLELLDWTEKAQQDGQQIDLIIVANKITDTSSYHHANFKKLLFEKFKQLGVRYYPGLPREEVLGLLKEVDFSWCWRPSQLEDNTLELSSKFLESIASGTRTICYPGKINKEIIGDVYPYFIESYEDFISVLNVEHDFNLQTLSENIMEKHSFEHLANTLLERTNTPSICTAKVSFAGHDFKFIDPYISYLKKMGVSVLRDVWGWGESSNSEWNEYCYVNSDILFCEWGLANAVWYSNRNIEKKQLFIRIHLQEINQKAQKFGSQINIENVTSIIFVSERVRNTALEMFNWPKEKTCVIPNFVLDDEFIPANKVINDSINIGLLGIIPSRKRLDRAVELLEILLSKGLDANLYIKGDRPEDLPYMHAPGRKEELPYYYEIYEKIKQNDELAKRVIFEPFGNNVAQWYEKIDFIVSSSDFESFHYALADGVLAGCEPLIWPWDEATSIYDPDWIVEDAQSASKHVMHFLNLTEIEKNIDMNSKREFISIRYGKDNVFSLLNQKILEVNLSQNQSNSINDLSDSYSHKYWENLYKNGGNSGTGSYGNLASFKANTINDFIKEHNIKNMIEFGTGDGNMLKQYESIDYVGYDVSKTVIQKLKELFKDIPTKQFHMISDYDDQTQYTLTLSIDVIFHLVEDEVYHDYMEKLFHSSSKFVIIYANNADEFEQDALKNASHMRSWKFSSWITKYAPEFKLKKYIPNPYPYEIGDYKNTSISSFYIYEKISENNKENNKDNI